jgi:hypothetical protein
LLVVFVPRTSSTLVATWFWQTEGRSAEHVILGDRPNEFILSEFQSPSRIILSAPIHSPLSGCLIGPSSGIEPVRVFVDSNQPKIQGWRTRNGVRVLHTSMARTTRCGVRGWVRSSTKRVKSFGMSRWTQAMSNRWTSSLQDRGTDSMPTIRRSTTCFVLCVSLSLIGCTPSIWLVEFGQF